MPGLRERKKAATNQRILDVALHMFRQNGYGPTRIEDIAERANLSVATFYNYFRSKADILLATVTVETEAILAAGEACIAEPHRSALEAFDALISGYYTNSFVFTSKEMWRITMAQIILHPETEFSQRYIELDGRLSVQVCNCIETLKGRDLVKPEIDVISVGELLFNNVNMNFIEYIRSDTLTAEDIREAVLFQSKPVIDNIATR